MDKNSVMAEISRVKNIMVNTLVAGYTFGCDEKTISTLKFSPITGYCIVIYANKHDGLPHRLSYKDVTEKEAEDCILESLKD